MRQGDDGGVPVEAAGLLRAETFDPLVGRSVRCAGTDFALVLDRVDRGRGPVPASMPRAPFTLIFSAAKGRTFLPEGMYRCDFGDGAIFDLHVAPIHTASADRQDYQAAFN